ncbi:MAG: hypothetical protein WD200_00955 [Candidatus Andersenbacteria bacterium]
MMPYKSFLGILLLLSGAAFAYAADTATIPLPTNTHYDAYISARIYENPFSTDPTQRGQGQVKAETDELPDVSIFIINKDTCFESAGDRLSYRILLRNNTDFPASQLFLTDIFPASARVIESVPIALNPPGTNRLEWNQRDSVLPPRGFLEYFFTLETGSTAPEFTNQAEIEYVTNSLKRASTTHKIINTCGVPDVPTQPLPNKLAAIVCDRAESLCVNFFPELGANFKKAQDPINQARICSQQQYRDSELCVQNLPTLGARFNEAKPVIKPGECRVQEDLQHEFDPLAIGPPVESTICESNGYPASVLASAPEPIKATRNEIRLPDTSVLAPGENTVINEALTRGSACSGAPGDPYWAFDCSCSCNDLLFVPGGRSEGRILNCQLIKQINRGDIYTTQLECLADIRHNQAPTRTNL